MKRVVFDFGDGENSKLRWEKGQLYVYRRHLNLILWPLILAASPRVFNPFNLCDSPSIASLQFRAAAELQAHPARSESQVAHDAQP